jgi:hypothetical protein
MYTVKIDISDWGIDEFVTIETGDFDKVQILQEFIELQKEYGWAVDYDVVVAEDEEVNDLEEELVDEDEPVTVSTYVITQIKE